MGNAQRLIKTTRRQEKRNLTFISFKRKTHKFAAQDSYRGRLEQVHIAVLRIGPQSGDPCQLITTPFRSRRPCSRSPTSASEADQLRGKPEASLYQAH